MFSFSVFIKSGFIAAVGKMADYQIILNAAGWFEKVVLSENDLSEIQIAIEEKNARIEAERLALEEAAETEEQPTAEPDIEPEAETEAETEVETEPAGEIAENTENAE